MSICSGSLAESGCREVLDKEIAKNPNWITTLAEYIRGISSGEYPESLLDVFYQRYNHRRHSPNDSPLDIYEAYAFGNMWYMFKTGELGILQLDVGGTPHGDKFVRENNEAICGISGEWEGRFWGGTQDEDGDIELLTAHHCCVLGKTAGYAIVPPSTFILEVGYISPQKMFANLNLFGSMARWPYGSTRITILTDRFIGTSSPEFDSVKSLAHDSMDTMCCQWINSGKFYSKCHPGKHTQ